MEATDDLSRIALRPALTPRETQVVGLIADGYTNDEIAGRIHASPATVKFHVGGLLAKLSAANRAHAAARAVRLGII